jgi:ATP-dependent DNA ligase
MTIPLTRPAEFNGQNAAMRKAYPSSTPLSTAPNRLPLLKYDGVCGIVEYKAGRLRMLSRTGEDYSVSCAVILEQVGLAMERTGHRRSNAYIMGEVWQPGVDQPTISGRFRNESTVCDTFEFRMFDFVDMDVPLESQPYYMRMERYRVISAAAIRMLKYAAPIYPATPDVSPEEMARSLGPGYDGIVIWDLMGTPLLDKKARAGQAIKFKPNITVDARVEAVIEGKGKHAGRLGALSISYNGKVSEVGTGFSDKQRAEFWANPPLGQIAEVEAMGYTPDGILREPRFKGLRFDKKESD